MQANNTSRFANATGHCYAQRLPRQPSTNIKRQFAKPRKTETAMHVNKPVIGRKTTQQMKTHAF